MSHVLDASALLAWILKEPGSERVRELLEAGECRLSAVNAAEIVAKLADKNRPAEALRQVIAHIGAECVPFDADQATEAGLLRPLTRHLGLSMGDRACLALARRRGGVVVTTDRLWLTLSEPLGLSIECIRP